MSRPSLPHRARAGALSLSLILCAVVGPSCTSEPAPPEPTALDGLTPLEVGPVVQTRLAELRARLEREPAPERVEVDEEELRGLLSMHVGARDRRMRDAAVKSLAEFGATSVDFLAGLLADQEAAQDDRRAAAEILGALATPDAIDALVACLEKDPSAWLRRYAAWTLGESGSDVGLPRMIHVLNYERDEECVAWLAGSLAKYGNLAGLDGLAQLRNSADENVRRVADEVALGICDALELPNLAACQALWNSEEAARLRAEPPGPLLELRVWEWLDQLSSAHFQLRGVDDARFILSRFGPWATGFVAEALADEDVHLRLHAIQVIERKGARGLGAGDALMRCLVDERVGHAAAEALGRIGYEPAREVLEAATDTRYDYELRVAAVRALGLLGSEASIPCLVALHADESQPDDMRLCAAGALVQCGAGDRVAPFLLERLTVPWADQRAAEVALETWIARAAEAERAAAAASEDSEESAVADGAATAPPPNDAGDAASTEDSATPIEAAAGGASARAALAALEPRWRALEGPPSLLITPEEIEARREARAKLVRGYLERHPASR